MKNKIEKDNPSIGLGRIVGMEENMRKLISFLAVVALLLFLPACGEKPGSSTQQTQPGNTGPEYADFEKQLRQDAFPADDAFMVVLGSAVKYRDLSFTGDKVSFIVQSPDIYEELVSWYETLDSMTESMFQDKVVELLKGEPVETSVTLNYIIRQDGSVEYQYTEQYLNAASCGLREFYGYLYERVMNEMEVDTDD